MQTELYMNRSQRKATLVTGADSQTVRVARIIDLDAEAARRSRPQFGDRVREPVQLALDLNTDQLKLSL